LRYLQKSGDYHSEKLYLVHGIESTENQALKSIVAWEIKRPAKQFDDIFYEFQFGRQHQTCLSVIILKQIKTNSFMLTKTPGIIIDNDATGAFYHVICGLALISPRSIGFATAMLGITWNKCKCLIKTGFGVSNIFYQSTYYKQTFGLGQGSTAASDIWCIINGIIMHIVATYFIGIVIISVSGTVQHKSAC
jgi:hypothetical protein